MPDPIANIRQRVEAAERALRGIVAPLIANDWSHVTTFGARYDVKTGTPYLLVGFDSATPAQVTEGIPSRVPDSADGMPVRVTSGSRVRFGG
jgi:hypothetical protein